MESRLPELFAELSTCGRARVLAKVAHMETIHARGVYNTNAESVGLQYSNEFVHKLVGHIAIVLAGQSTAKTDASFMNMVLENVARRGATESERLGQWILGV